MKKAPTANFPEFEAEMLKVWASEKTFEQSLELRRYAKRFSFYDGPPFANGLPHYGHVVALTEKDAVTRYKTMRGYYVPRRNVWKAGWYRPRQRLGTPATDGFCYVRRAR